jgi:hypothetical protein
MADERHSVISDELDQLLNKAFLRAQENRQEYLTVEHILLGLIDAPSLHGLWRAFQMDRDYLRERVTHIVDKKTPHLADDDEQEVQPTLGFQRTLQRALFFQQSSGKKEVTSSDVLIAILNEKESDAASLLELRGLTRAAVAGYFKSGGKSAPAPPSRKATELAGAASFREELAEIERVDFRRRPQVSESPKLFISYSHIDKACLERLLVHLKPLERANLITCWSDTRLRTGDKWREEITKNIGGAALAILLVSADFLASDFIVDNELPPLLVGAAAGGTRILPVILKPCGFLRDRVLSAFQSLNDPRAPLLGLNHIEQEALYNRLADEIVEELRVRGVNVS